MICVNQSIKKITITDIKLIYKSGGKTGLLRMISYNKAFKDNETEYQSFKKTEKIDIQDSHMRIISRKFYLKPTILEMIFSKNGWYCNFKKRIKEK